MSNVLSKLNHQEELYRSKCNLARMPLHIIQKICGYLMLPDARFLFDFELPDSLGMLPNICQVLWTI